MPADHGEEEGAVLAAARAGDHAAFAALSERYRRLLRAHCYRMLGSFDEAEDMVQEVLLRAWRGREGFQGRSLFRTWLYCIATNACLNALERAPPRVLPQDLGPPVTASTPASQARSTPPWAPEVPWLQPFPDDLLDAEPPADAVPADAVVEARETIALAFLAALQHLPPRQRAVLILSDVVGWSAAEVAELLELTVPSVTSALQRARSTLRARFPAGAPDPSAGAQVTGRERAALKVFMDAWEQGDAAELTRLLREDARWAMPPAPLWFDGRAAIANMLALFPPRWQGREFRMAPVGANRQPAVAAYLRRHGEAVFRLSGIHVLRVSDGQIAEITTFSAELCAGFRLPSTLTD
ncbi:RNA polymerase subunit sigma-70 [Sorangium sp. So ce291]|uniref:RNA polymerase subunit sigma-70 n=1 Tax=Sorangium sp. So ce291 TaxID=3133294 RepID=UPI003F5EE939